MGLPDHTIVRTWQLDLSRALFDSDGNHVTGKISVGFDDVGYDGDEPGGESRVEAVVIEMSGTPRDSQQTRDGQQWTEGAYGVGGFPLMDPDDLKLTIPVELLRELLAYYDG